MRKEITEMSIPSLACLMVLKDGRKFGLNLTEIASRDCEITNQHHKSKNTIILLKEKKKKKRKKKHSLLCMSEIY